MKTDSDWLRFALKKCFMQRKMLSYNRHCGFSYCPFASTASQDSAAMQLESTGNNGCSVVHWVGGRRRKWGRQKRGKGCMGTERDWYCVRGRELKKKKKDTGRVKETRENWSEREQQRASSPGVGLRPVQLSTVWLWVRRRGWRLCYALSSGHTVQLEAVAVASAQI